MGCWNATCMLTRLPILHDEPCLAILMVPVDPDYQNMTDPAGMYMPITPLIRGDYDNYGCLEYIRNIPEITSCLGALEFRVRCQKDGKTVVSGVESIIEKFQDEGTADAAIQDIMKHANRCELEAFIKYAGGRAAWKPVYLGLMKKPFAEMLIQNSRSHVRQEELSSVTFRIKTAGPLQEALRKLDARYGADLGVKGPDISRTAAIELLALFNGLITMRIGFAPQCGAGGQDAMDEPWQREFYLKAWAAAETMARRYYEEPQKPFYAMSSWDGYNLTMLPGIAAESHDQPVDAGPDDPDELYRDLLEHAARNLTMTMDMSQDRAED